MVHIITNHTKSELYKLSAVTSGVKDIKEVLEKANSNRFGLVKTILFIDEIHRLNKAQQDVLLPDVENGNIILIGATTENPSFEINKALLSRSYVVTLSPLTEDDLITLLKRALTKDYYLKLSCITYTDEALRKIAVFAGGDARNALNILECVIQYYPEENNKEVAITLDVLDKVFANQSFIYDKHGDEHYNIISALHKSMRNSDLRFASEDIGLADYKALSVATSAYQAVHYIGMPECSVNLTQAVVYLSVAPKSNSLYIAYEKAKKDAIEIKGAQVPLHLRNASSELIHNLNYGKNYQYAHDYEGYITNMKCLPENLEGKEYYIPKQSGGEKVAAERLKQIETLRKNQNN